MDKIQMKRFLTLIYSVVLLAFGQNGYAAEDVPALGKVYAIRNCYFKTVMAANPSESNIKCVTGDGREKLNLWKLVDAGDHKSCYIQNVANGLYIGASARGQRHPLSATPFPFVLRQNPKIESSRAYDILIDGWTLNCAPDSYLVNWTVYDGKDNLNGAWTFEEIITDTDDLDTPLPLAISTPEYDVQYMRQYNEVLTKFYADFSATALRDKYQAMSDEQLAQEMQRSNLNQTIIQQAIKIKNQNWAKYQSGNNWEKRFRINKYQPFSDNVEWCQPLGLTVKYGCITAPTGIYAQAGEVLYIYVGSQPGTGAQLSLESYGSIPDTQYSPSLSYHHTLNRGHNIIKVESDGNLFINYQAKTFKPTRYLTAYPDITIRIEGGKINGYFDLTRGDTNADWKAMLADGLFFAPIINMRTPHLVFHMNSRKVIDACGGEMVEILNLWDKIVEGQTAMMAMTDKYIPELSQRFNCKLNCFSFTRTDYWMYAYDWGAYFREDALSEMLNYRNMLVNLDKCWGLTHELGHLHQGLINMATCTEASNGLFSNAYIWDMGQTVTRGNCTLQNDCFNLIANGGSWPELPLEVRMRMYSQLEMYFSKVLGDKDFYSRLASLLRSDRMKEPTRGVISGSTDYLKFACKACDAAQMDLSDFFEAYGFFVPIHLTGINVDRVQEFVTTTDDINKAKAYMRQYPKANPNICFIEDRLDTHQPTAGAGCQLSQYRKAYNPGLIGSAVGDVGQYTDFLDASQRAQGYTCSVQGDKVHISAGSGAVGFKLKDASGRIICLSNRYVFDIPQKYVGTKFQVFASQADGSDIEIPNI